MAIVKTITVEATPRELAEAFWALGSDQQAEFFAECQNVSEQAYKEWQDAPKHNRGMFIPGYQWHDIGRQCLKLEGGLQSKAAQALAEMSASLYVHASKWLY